MKARLSLMGASVPLVVAVAFTFPPRTAVSEASPPQPAQAETDFHQAVPDWENPSVIGINKEAPRATAFPFESAELAEAGKPGRLGVLPASQRGLALSLGSKPRGTPAGLLPGGLRRFRLGLDPRAVQLGGSGLRRAHLPQPPLRIREEPAVHPS